MKRQYNQPACMVVELGTIQMMAESLTINTNADSSQTIDASEQILTKEITDVNLWDKEW